MKILELSQYIQAIIVILGAMITLIAFFTTKGQAFIQKVILSPVLKKIETLDINQCKCHLTDFLSEVEKGENKSENQIKRAYEVYDHYINDLKQNSYVHAKWEELQKKGVI